MVIGHETLRCREVIVEGDEEEREKKSEMVRC